MNDRKINDKIIEQIFNSIIDYNKFYSDFITRTDIDLENDIKIRFILDLNVVEIYIKQNKYVIDRTTFSNIMKEILEEAKSIDQQRTSENQQKTNKKKRDKILYLGNKTHQVDVAYINFMYEVKVMNTASTYNLYIQRLQKLIDILKIGDCIIIDTTEIKSLDDLVSYLTRKGFGNIIDDLKDL